MTGTTGHRRKYRLIFQDPEETNAVLGIILPASTFVYSSKNGLPSKGSSDSKKKRKSNEDRRDDNPPESSFPPYRIMVVDDEPDIVSVLKKGLQRNGFHVTGYTNPVEALSNFARHRYDIVLTDIRMSQMNGIDLFRRLRAIDDGVLICFVTAHDQFRQEFQIAYPEEQAGCFIPKPISIDRLVGTITRKMEERESRWRRRI
jgi:CheY-like chemotaxis protein